MLRSQNDINVIKAIRLSLTIPHTKALAEKEFCQRRHVEILEFRTHRTPWYHKDSSLPPRFYTHYWNTLRNPLLVDHDSINGTRQCVWVVNEWETQWCYQQNDRDARDSRLETYIRKRSRSCVSLSIGYKTNQWSPIYTIFVVVLELSPLRKATLQWHALMK